MIYHLTVGFGQSDESRYDKPKKGEFGLRIENIIICVFIKSLLASYKAKDPV